MTTRMMVRRSEVRPAATEAGIQNSTFCQRLQDWPVRSGLRRRSLGPSPKATHRLNPVAKSHGKLLLVADHLRYGRKSTIPVVSPQTIREYTSQVSCQNLMQRLQLLIAATGRICVGSGQ